MSWIRAILVFLALLQGGWMVADGTHALVTGDYVRFMSRNGDRGELGAWAEVVKIAGLDPASQKMKCIFIAYGALWIGVAVLFVRRNPWSRVAMLVVAIGSLWYVGIATPMALTQILLLVLLSPRDFQPLPAASG